MSGPSGPRGWRGTRGTRGFRGSRGHGGQRGFRGSHQRTRDERRQWKSMSKNDRYLYHSVQRKFGGPNEQDKVDDALSELTEDQVYITEFVSDHEGFLGILKSRISDFNVNEIDLDGKECVLSDFSLPIPPLEEDDAIAARKQLTELVPQDTLQRMEELADSQENNKDVVELDVTDLTKEDRGNIHNSVKVLFKRKLAGNTVSKGEKKFIEFVQFRNRVGPDRREWIWPEQYVYFALYKDNIDTIQAINQLAEHVRQKPSLFSYAGTKDRRARTTQWISISRVDPSKIVAAARKINSIKVGNFSFNTIGLKLGDLSGNRFRIALRHIDADEALIKKSMESFEQNGFINYFGLQRFGNCVEIPTHKIGIQILKGNYREACDLILKPRKGDFWYMKEMREEWAISKNAEQALAALFKPNNCVERMILLHLINHSNDFAGAILKIPRNMRSLYLHAYQSIIWNRMVSRRIREFGLKLIPGDLVFKDRSSETVEVVEVEEENIEEETPDDEKASVPERSKSYFKDMVRPLTDSDIASGRYSLFDLVMPLPGHDITYPANIVATWYEETMAEDGLSSEKFKTSTRKDSVTGAYRKVFIKPGQVTWEIVKHENYDDQLIQSDFEKLVGKPELKFEGDLLETSLLLNFTLPPSCYATMAVREINRMDTSAKHQRKMEIEARIEESEGIPAAKQAKLE